MGPAINVLPPARCGRREIKNTNWIYDKISYGIKVVTY